MLHVRLFNGVRGVLASEGLWRCRRRASRVWFFLALLGLVLRGMSCVHAAEISLDGPRTVKGVVGEPLVLEYRASSAGAVLVDLTSRSKALMGAFQVQERTNTAKGSEIRGVLRLFPMQDAAGVHEYSVRAVTADGTVAELGLQVVLESNPKTPETRWVGGKGGAWDDKANWSAGVPTAEMFAVVESQEKFEISLGSAVVGRGVIVNAPGVQLVTGTSTALEAPMELRAGTLGIHHGATLQVQQSLVSAGTVVMVSRQSPSGLTGKGIVKNVGSVEVYQGGGSGSAWEAVISLPVLNGGGGTLKVGTDAFLALGAGGEIENRGRMELVSGGRLRLGEARTELVAAGGTFTGRGQLLLQGGSRLRTVTESIVEPVLVLEGESYVDGLGRLSLTGEQTLTGRYGPEVEILGTSHLNGARFEGKLTVRKGGAATVLNGRTVDIRTELVNEGTLSLISRQSPCTVTGAGTVRNRGEIVVFQGGGSGSGWEARVDVPVVNEPGAVFRVGDNAYLVLGAPSRFENRGELAIHPGAQCRTDAGAAVEIVSNGGGFTGPGVLEIAGSGRLASQTPTSISQRLRLVEKAEVVGDAKLSIEGPQGLTGRYRGTVELAPGATVDMNGAVIEGTLTVAPAAVMTVGPGQTLTVQGLLVNQGLTTLASRQGPSTVNGGGRFRNEGLVSVVQTGGSGSGWQANIQVPVLNSPGARWLVDVNGFLVHTRAGAFENQGFLEIRPGGRMRLDGGETPVELIANGGRFEGPGALELVGADAFVTKTATTLPQALVMSPTATVRGTATLTLEGEQTLAGIYEGSFEVAAGAVVHMNGATFGGTLTVQPGGVMTVLQGRRLVLDGELVNRGLVNLVSRQGTSEVVGKGRIRNEGVVAAFQGGGSGSGWEAAVRVPVVNGPAGRWLIDANAFLVLSGEAHLENQGVVEIRAGGRMRLDGGDAPRELVSNGGRFEGPGALVLAGADRFVVKTPTRMLPALVASSKAIVDAAARLTFDSEQTLEGTYAGEVAVGEGTIVHMNGAVVNGTFTVDKGGTLTVLNGRTLVLNGSLVNRGQVTMASRQAQTVITGAGRIRNLGVFAAFQAGGSGSGWEAWLNVPMDLEPGSRLRLEENAFLRAAGRGQINHAGTVALSPGSMLRLAMEEEPRELVVHEGALFEGRGVLRVEEGNRVAMLGKASVLPVVQLAAGAKVVGLGTLTLLGDQQLTGVYEAPVQFGSGASVSIPAATFTNHVTVATQAVVQIPPGGVMTLTGVLTNNGTVRLASRQGEARLVGLGTVVNLGLFEVYQSGGSGSGWEAWIEAAFLNTVGGRLLISDNGYAVVLPKGRIENRGVQEIRAGARLRFGAADQPTELVASGGGRFEGPGALVFDGQNRLVVQTPAAIPHAVILGAQASINAASRLTLTGRQTLTGTYTGFVEVGADAVVYPDRAVFDGTLSIAEGGTLDLLAGREFTLNGVLTNRGKVLLASRAGQSRVLGRGKIDTAGTVEVYQSNGSGSGWEAVLLVPVVVHPAGRFLASPNGFASFVGPASLRVAGGLDSGAGSRVQFVAADGGAQPALVFDRGNRLTGGGLLSLTAGQIHVAADTVMPIAFALSGDARVDGVAELTLTGAHTLTGTYVSPVVVAAGAQVTLQNPLVKGSLRINSGAEVSVPAGGSLRLDGVVENEGTLSLGSRAGPTTLTGAGVLKNRGVVQSIQSGGSGSGWFSTLRVVVELAEPGRLVAAEAGYLAINSPGSLRGTGTVTLSPGSLLATDTTNRFAGVVRSSGLLRTDNATAAWRLRELRLEAGSAIQNPGVICAASLEDLGVRLEGNPIQRGSCVDGFPPIIAPLPDQWISGATSSTSINVSLDDRDTDPARVTLTAVSANPALLPDSSITLGGNGRSRTLRLQPVPGLIGSALVLLTAADPEGNLTTETFNLAVSADERVVDCLPAPAGLVAWWPGDSLGTEVLGGGTAGNSGSFGVAAGKSGQAFSFDGVSQLLTVADRPALRLTNAVTLEFWAKRRRVGLDVVLEKGGDWTRGGTTYGVGLHAINNAMFYFFFAGGWRGVDGVSDEEWHHYAVTATNGAADAEFYIDGVVRPVVHREGAGVVRLADSTAPLNLGGQSAAGGPAHFANLLLDEVSLYGRVLGPAEITQIYRAGTAGKCPAQPLITVPVELAAGTVGAPYTETLGAALGVRPYRFALGPGSGPLPPGLSLLAAGQIAGVPAAAGSFPFVVEVTDAAQARGSRPFVLEVRAGNTLPTLSSIPAVTLDPGQTGTVNFTLADAETPLDRLTVTVSSSNVGLFPSLAEGLSGTGASRTLRLAPAAGGVGSAFITVAVVDSGGGRATSTFLATVIAETGLDSDGDGVPDARELRAGTDPLNKSDFFGFPAPPAPKPGGLWSITIRTVPGRTYVLQAMDLIGRSGGGWQDVARVKATGPTTTLEDPSPSATGLRFYRTALIEETPLNPPQLADLTINNRGGDRFRLGVRVAGGNAEPSRVEFFDGNTLLGAGVLESNRVWGFTNQFPLNSIHEIRAVATDASGATGASESVRALFPDPAFLAPVDVLGRARFGEPVVLGDGSRLPAVELRPGGPDPLGADRHFRIRIPAGAVFVAEGASGGKLEFTEAIGSFGPGSPVQLAQSLRRVGGAPKRLDIGSVNLGDLLAAFDQDRNAGLELRVFGRVPLVLKAGRFDSGGMSGARIGLERLALALPNQSLPDLQVDFNSRDGIRIPLSGLFTLPDGSQGPAQVTVPASRPIWLVIRPDGELQLSGHVDVKFPGDGPEFSADVRLTPPIYELGLSARGLNFRFLSAFRNLLPQQTAACSLAPTAAPEQARNTILCLTRLSRGYARFNAADANLTPADGTAGTPTAALAAAANSIAPSEPYEATASALDASAYFGLAGSRPTELDALLTELFDQSGDAARAGENLEAILAIRETFERARVGGLRASNPARFDLGLQKAVAAAVRQASQPESTRSLASLRKALGILVRTEVLIQSLPSEQPATAILSDAALRNAMTGLVSSFLDAEATTLGVTPTALLPDQNSIIRGMSRFHLYQKIADLLEVAADAQRLGVDGTINGPLQTALRSQLGVQLNRLVEQALTDADAASDYRAYTLALGEQLDLVALVNSGFFPEAVRSRLPGASELDTAAARLDAVFGRDPSASFSGMTSMALGAQLRALLNVYSDVPTQLRRVTPPVQRAYTGLTEAVNRGVTGLAANTDPTVLADLLEAGLLLARLRDQFELNEAQPWESEERLGAVVRQLTTVGVRRRAWSQLHRGTQLLLTEARQRSAASATDSARVNFLVNQALPLLGAERTVAESSPAPGNSPAIARLGVQPAAQVASLPRPDLALPGGIMVDAIGGLVRYDAGQREVAGRFSGRLRMPGFGLALTVSEASFSSGGAFKISTFGSVVVPSAADPKARFTVSEARPLEVSFSPPEDLRISGAGTLEVNGMTFEAHATLDDPIYSFGASARGLRLDLLRAVQSLAPTLPEGDLAPDAVQAAADYFDSLLTVARPLAAELAPTAETAARRAARMSEEDGELPLVGDSSAKPTPTLEPPKKKPRLYQRKAAALEHWINEKILAIRLGAVRDYSATAGVLADSLQKLARELDGPTPGVGRAPGDLTDIDRLEETANFVLKVCGVISQPGVPNHEQILVTANSVEFRALLTAFYARLIQVLNAPDAEGFERKELDRLIGVLRTVLGGASCFPQPSVSGVREAYGVFLERQVGLALSKLGAGLQPGAGVNRAVFDTLNRAQIRLGMTALVEMAFQIELIGAGDAQNVSRYRLLVGELLLLFRQRAIERSLEKIPTTYTNFVARVDQLRFPESDRSKPLVDMTPLLQYYSMIREIRDDLLLGIELIQRLGADTDFGSRPVPNLYAPSAPYSLGTEVQNALRAFGWALNYANNADANGNPIQRDDARPETLGDRRLAPTRFAGRSNCRPDLDALALFNPIPETQSNVSGVETLIQQLVNASMPNWIDCFDTGIESSEVGSEPKVAIVNRLLVFLLKARLGANQQIPSLRLYLAHVVDQLVQAGLSGPASLAQGQPAPVSDSSLAEILEVARAIASAAADPSLAQDPELRGFLSGLGTRLVKALVAPAAEAMARLPSNVLGDLLLPGGLVVNNVFGEVSLNRATREISGAFGGRVEFPGLDNAYFEINRATLDNRFNFSLTASAGNLALGPGRLVNGTVTIAGQPGDRQFQFSGSGQMSFNGGTAVNVGISYLSATRDLVFSSDVSNAEGVLKLTDHAVLYRAGLALTLNTRAPAGELVTSGTVGLIARGQLSSPPRDEDFQLVVQNARTELAFDLPARAGSFKITGGQLLLPTNFTAGICRTGAVAGSSRPTIGIPAERPVAVVLKLTPDSTATAPVIESIRMNAALAVENLGLRVPGLDGLAAEICSADLVLPTLEISNGSVRGSLLPTFSIREGRLQFPLPPGQTNMAILRNAVIDFEGLPTGEVLLADDVQLLNTSAVQLELLGGNSCGNDRPATALKVERVGGLPVLTLRGGVRFSISEELLQNESAGSQGGGVQPVTNRVQLVSCGSVVIRPNAFPEFSLDTVAVEGNFRLPGGVALQGGALRLENLRNVFNLSPNPPEPFTIGLSGTIFLPEGPGFGLRNTKFVFNNLNRDLPGLPQFVPGTLIYDGSRWELTRVLPIQVSHAEFGFKDGTVALPRLLHPTNLTINTTAALRLPTAENPVIGGGVNDLTITFEPDGRPKLSLEGISLDVQPGALKLPPINDLGGRLYLGGFNHPDKLFFAGRLSGSYGETKVALLGAVNTRGPIGFCLDVRGGSAGIPLLWGFSFNGASGGVSLANNNSSPCDFTTYIDTASGKPRSDQATAPSSGITWEQLLDFVTRFEQRARDLALARPAGVVDPSETLESLGIPFPSTDQLRRASLQSARPQAGSGGSGSLGDPADAIPCPGDCPPYTVNIFCQPHPEPVDPRHKGRVILKFTSIEEQTLNRFQITEERIANLLRDSATTSASIARLVAASVRSGIEGSVPLPPANTPARRSFEQLFQSIQDGFTSVLTLALNASPRTARGIYEAIRDAAYAGLPCPDVTYMVSGTFSHSAVSAFMSVTGDGTLSTTGTAGVGGQVNFLGLPVGRGKVFLAATDAQGLPNPSLCAEINVTMGPLDFGNLRAGLQCEGCVSGIAAVFGRVVVGLGQETVNAVLREVAPQFVGLPADQLIQRLPESLQNAFIATLLRTGPGSYGSAVQGILIDAIDNALDIFDPELLLCGQVNTKLFGVPMGGKLGSVSMRISRRGIEAFAETSPSGLVSRLLTDPRFSPGLSIDNATVGMFYPYGYEEYKAVMMAALRGQFAGPEAVGQFVKEQFRRFIERSSVTASYELEPLGISLARAQGRVIMPDFTRHPVVFGYTRPERRGLPSRVDLLHRILRSNRLADPFWQGREGQLSVLYPSEADTALQLQTKTLTRDYFPYGGFVGAGYIDVPKAFFDPPPTELGVILNPNTNLLARTFAAITYINDYLLKTTNAGQMAFYVPAPNPPRALIQAPQIDLEAVLQAMNRFEIPAGGLASLSQELYPYSEGFLTGFLTNRFLGVDIGTATIEGVPAGNGGDAYLRGEARMANNDANWLKHFVDSARLDFEIRQSPTQSVAITFGNWKTNLTRLNTDAERLAAIDGFISALYTGLPKAKLEATLENVRISPEMQQRIGRLLTVPTGSGTFQLAAYTPRFNTNAAGTGPVALAQRNGGIAMTGRVNLGNIHTGVVELAVLPKPYDPLGTTVPPDLFARVNITTLPLPGGVLMQNAALDLDTRSLALAVTGRVTQVNLGPLMRIAPPTGQSGLAANFRIAPVGTGINLSLSPAVIQSTLLLGGGRQIAIHGATPTAPFTYASDAPWSASASLIDQQPFELRDPAGKVLFQTARTNVEQLTFTRNTAGVTEFTLRLPANREFVFLPGDALQQRLQLQAASTLRVASDGSFNLTGSSFSAASLPATLSLPVGQVSAGAQLTLERVVRTRDAQNQPLTYDTRLSLVGRMTGGMLPDGTATAVSSRLVLSTVSGVRLTGDVGLPSLAFGPFVLRSSDGKGFAATLASNGLRVQQTAACLEFSGLQIACFTLSDVAPGPRSLGIDPGGAVLGARGAPLSFPVTGILFPVTNAFSIYAGPVSANLFGYTLANASLRFGRENGRVYLPEIRGSLALPGFNSSASVSGSLNEDGSMRLESAATLSASLPAGWGVGAITSAKAVLDRHFEERGSVLGFPTIVAVLGLRLEGAMSAGALSQLSGFGTASGSLELSSSGITSGQVSVDEMRLGPFTVRAADNGRLSAGVTSTGLILDPRPVVLRYNGTEVTRFDLPARGLVGLDQRFRIPASGDFTWFQGSLTTRFFNQDLASTRFSLGRVNAAHGMFNISGTTAAFPVVGSLQFTGSITSQAFSLSAQPTFSIGSFGVTGPVFNLGSAGITGSGILDVGTRDIPLNFSAVTPSGVSFSGSTGSLDTGWQRVFDSPPPPGLPNPRSGDIYVNARFSLSASANGFTGGTFRVQASGTAAAWVDPGTGDKPANATTASLRFTFPATSMSTSTLVLGIPGDAAWNPVRNAVPSLSYGLW